VERYSDCGTGNVCNCEWGGRVTVTGNVCNCEWGGTVTVEQAMFVTVSGQVQ